MTDLKRLFSPWTLRGHSIKNRIGVPPLVVYSWGDETGMVTDRHVKHYYELAHGGAGFVRQEATSVSETGRLTMDQLGIWKDEQKEGLGRIKNVLKAAGMPAVLQLSHAGLLAKRPEDRVSPSFCGIEQNGEHYEGRALSIDEIQKIESDFIAAARRAFEIGYDGVELHACHGYLLSQFMNARVNLRTDRYCSADNLFLSNIIDGIRRVTSDDFLIGIRLGVFEPDIETGIKNAIWLETKGVSYIEAYYGCDWASEPRAPESFPFNSSIYGAKKVKEAVQIPVFTGFEITSGQQAEAILAETGADMVTIGRGHLVNPKWGRAVRAGLNPGSCFRCGWCMWKLDPDQCPGGRLVQEREKADFAEPERLCRTCGGMEIAVTHDRSLESYKIKKNKKDEIINMIIEAEWEMFDEVNNVGGRADCQDDGKTFYIMRYSGHCCLSEQTLTSYYEDIRAAKDENRNLITEKYAYMMEKTDKEYFDQALKPYLPEISEEKRQIIDEIVAIKVESERAFVKAYPWFSQGSRPTETDERGIVSVKSYEAGELKTYSVKTLKYYLEDMRKLENKGKGPSFVVRDKMVKLYGYDSVRAAEDALRIR